MGEVERWGWVLGADGENGGIDRRPDGNFVRYAAYKACEKAGRLAFERWGEAAVRVIRRELETQDQLTALRSALQGEVERLRDEAARCRDEALKRRHKVTADLALGEGSAIDRRADRLQAILDSSASEQKGADQ